MAETSNLDAFFEAQFKTARRVFEESDDDDYEYEGQLLNLLEDPALPLTLRVTCCNPQNAEFYHDEGIRVLAQIDEMIEQGRVGVRLKPWVERATANFEALHIRIQDQLEDLIEEEEDASTAIADKGKGLEVQQGEGAQREEETATIMQKDDEDRAAIAGKGKKAEVQQEGDTIMMQKDEVDDDAETASSSIQPSQDTSTIEGIPHRAVSTEHTSIPAEPAIAATAEREKSPPLHPAVQQMEDDADMLFGTHTDYENWTAEQRAEWDAGAADRVRERMREEQGDDERGDGSDGEHSAKK